MTVTIKIVSIFILTLFVCNSYSQITLPKNLNDAINFFQQEWSSQELDDFKRKSENTAISELHFGTGMWIRNTWIRGNRDTALANYFHSLGVFHPDDISSIILRSLHRTLNKKNIKLETQISDCKEGWKPIIDCHAEVKKTALANYNKFKIGDTVLVKMPVNENKNAVIYQCPTIKWKFDSKKDLLVRGIVKRKYYINDPSNVFFTLTIIYLNRVDIQVLMSPIKVGDLKDFSLNRQRIE